MNIVCVFEFFCGCSSPRRCRGLNLNLFDSFCDLIPRSLVFRVRSLIGLRFIGNPRVNLGRLHNFLSLEEALIRVWALSRIGVREKSL